MPERKAGYVAYLDLDDFLAEVEHLRTHNQLGLHPTVRLQALSTPYCMTCRFRVATY